MSIATMNWALTQRLESAAQQSLLYVIADSADPNGVTRHCDPDYMAIHSRMSRASMFRRLAEMEAFGLLTRRKFYTESGAPRYEISLNLDVQVNLPLKTRRKGDDDDDGEGGDGQRPSDDREQQEYVATEKPESHPETLPPPESHHAETGTVSPVRPTQSHSCDSISPPLSKSLPPNPPPGGLSPSLSKKEAQQSERHEALWPRFIQGYPGIAAMDQQAAREEFDELSVDDAEWAVSVLLTLKDELRSHKRPPKNAHIWLRKGMFRNFPRGKLEAPPPEAVWIAEGSDEDRALRFIRSLARVPYPFVKTRPDGSRGYLNKTEVGADLLAMLIFADQTTGGWPKVDRGSQHFASWQARFAQWIGAPIPIEPGSNQIRVPTLWPPSKTGKIYPDDSEGEGETA